MFKKYNQEQSVKKTNNTVTSSGIFSQKKDILQEWGLPKKETSSGYLGLKSRDSDYQTSFRKDERDNSFSQRNWLEKGNRNTSYEMFSSKKEEPRIVQSVRNSSSQQRSNLDFASIFKNRKSSNTGEEQVLSKGELSQRNSSKDLRSLNTGLQGSKYEVQRSTPSNRFREELSSLLQSGAQQANTQQQAEQAYFGKEKTLNTSLTKKSTLDWGFTFNSKKGENNYSQTFQKQEGKEFENRWKELSEKSLQSTPTTSQTNKYVPPSLRRENQSQRSLKDVIPLHQLREMQDLLKKYNQTDVKAIDQEYAKELVNLASTIIDTVRSLSYQTRRIL